MRTDARRRNANVPFGAKKPINVKPWQFVFFSVVYDEFLLHIWTMEGFNFLRLICVLLFGAATASLFAFLSLLFPKSAQNRNVALILAGLMNVLSLVEFFINDAFGTFFSLSMIFTRAGDVMGDFAGTVFGLIFKNIWRIALVFIPFFAYWILSVKRRIKPQKKKFILRLAFAVASVVVFFIARGFALGISPDANKYSSEYTFEEAVHGFGIVHALRLDIFGTGDNDTDFEDVNYSDTSSSSTSSEEENPVVYGQNKLDIDFDKLIANTSSKNIKSIHQYVASQTPSNKNKYTGLCKGKNLILVTAESFSAEVISEELTPTLYRMANKGIKFTDYYQPEWGGSTTTGEYTNITGLAPAGVSRAMQSTVGKNMYFTMGNQLKRLGYTSFAYHNNTYTYYSRDKTHENLGYEHYIGMGNGLEKGVKKRWPASDQEMIDFTIGQYIDKQPFSIYYMTVSGHCNYTKSGNSMAKKNETAVKDLPYSDIVKNYIACNLELEYAMRDLVAALEEKGIADDTVIVISCDHYPYGLEKSDAWETDKDYLSELYGGKVDNVFLQAHSALIMWSGCFEDMNIVIDSPTYSLDIVPTLSNLFGTEYDSRLLVGRDVLSDTEALAMWPNYSWKTDKGTYDSKAGKFTPNPGVTVSDDYVKNMSAVVKNKIKYSKWVLENDYYNILFPKKK